MIESYADGRSSEWHTLAEEMALSEEFLAAHQESILNVICENGAYIARTYAGNLDEVQREAFYRVVKAELMGQRTFLLESKAESRH